MPDIRNECPFCGKRTANKGARYYQHVDRVIQRFQCSRENGCRRYHMRDPISGDLVEPPGGYKGAFALNNTTPVSVSIPSKESSNKESSKKAEISVQNRDWILTSPSIDRLTTLLEEATRSTKEGVKRFVEPSHGVLVRTSGKRHHIVFGRRGSGKSSLLAKAASDLTVDRRPIAQVDLESFKGHSYPDVLISILIQSLENFEDWLRNAAINPATKTSFWERLFGSKPKRPALNKNRSIELANKFQEQVIILKKHLHSADYAQLETKLITGHESSEQEDFSADIGKKDIASISYKIDSNQKRMLSEEQTEQHSRSKSDYLHRQILEYQSLFRELASLSSGDAFLFLDDLYHIRRSDQAKVLDYFHRIAKGNSLWLKVGTIRHRTDWYIHGDPPIGLKLGDDADDIDLDLTLEKYSTAKDFLLKILSGFIVEAGAPPLEDIITDGAADRLVLASGGVARDFLGIFRRSVAAAIERGLEHPRGPRVSAEDVNMAAGEYDQYKREELKRDTLDDRNNIEYEFSKIIDFCVRKTKCNVFLLDKDIENTKADLVSELVDLRLIHRISSRVTVKNFRAGHIYDAFMLDVSQYTGERKMRGIEILEFWKNDERDKLRKASLIYEPSSPVIEVKQP